MQVLLMILGGYVKVTHGDPEPLDIFAEYGFGIACAIALAAAIIKGIIILTADHYVDRVLKRIARKHKLPYSRKKK